MGIINKSESLFMQLVKIGKEIAKIEESWEEDDFENCTKLENEFEANFLDLIEQSAVDNYYWQYCPFDVFKLAINDKKEQYIKRGNSFTEATFYDEEIRNIKHFLVRPGKTSKGKELGVNKDEVYINFALPITQIGETQIKFKYHCVPVLNINTKTRIISTQKQKIKYLKELKRNIKKGTLVRENNFEHDIFKEEQGLIIFENYIEKYWESLKSSDIAICALYFLLKNDKHLKNKLSTVEFANFLSSYAEQIDHEITLGKIRTEKESLKSKKHSKQYNNIVENLLRE